MPLPSPHGAQDHKDFISSCMGSNVMRKEYPKQDQRYAVCESQWKRAKKAKGESANWEESEAEIARDHMIQTEDEIRVVIPRVDHPAVGN